MQESLAKKHWGQLDQVESANGFGSITTMAPLFYFQNKGESIILPFMYLYGKTRNQCFLQGFIDLNTDREDIKPTLSNCHLLLLQGKYRQAKKLNEILTTAEPSVQNSKWSAYINDIDLMVAGQNDIKQELRHLLPNEVRPLDMQLWLQVVRNAIRLGDWNGSMTIIEKLKTEVSKLGLSQRLRLIIDARLERHETEINLKKGSEKPLKLLLAKAEEISFAIDQNLRLEDYEGILLIETFRRIVDYVTFYFLGQKKYNEALIYISKIKSIDPNCPRFHLLYADCLRLTGKDREACRHYILALELGTLDRVYALDKIKDMETELKFFKDYIIGSTLLNDHSGIGELVSKKDFNPYLTKSSDSNFRTINSVTTEIRSRIKRNPIYSHFKPFFELQPSEGAVPLLCNTPLYLFKAMMDDESPWFQTITCQRALVYPIRQELIFAHLRTLEYDHEIMKANGLEFFSTFSDSAATILQMYSERKTLDALKLSYLGRLLASLGFFEEAIETLLTIPPKSDIATLNFLNSCLYFVQAVFNQTAPKKKEFISTSEFYYQIPIISETLRIRFSVSLNACVRAGQAKNLTECLLWREQAQLNLNKIQECEKFSDFEKCLLTSRFYRGVSYAPFLSGNKKQLLLESQLCESFANEKKAENQKQNILRLENMFPMLETTARISQFLNDPEEATVRLKRIVDEVDPLDSKAWLQLGDHYEKQKDLTNAFDAFSKSAVLACPHGRISWFKVGSLAEKLGYEEVSRFAHLESLKHWPYGKSPLAKLKAKTMDWTGPISEWAKIAFESLDSKNI